MTRKERELLEEWNAHKQLIKKGQPRRDPKESARDRQLRIDKARLDYAFFAREYFPHYVSSEVPWFHKALADQVLADPHIKAIVEWYRGAAKSVLTDVLLPLWLMVQEECQLKCMVVVGVNETAAIRLLNDVKAELEFNEYFCSEFGIGKKTGDWADKQFSASNGSMFVALGMGQSVRGLRKGQDRPDYLVIDDVDDLETSRNPERITRMCEWIERSVLGVFTAKRSRFFIVNNRIAEDQVMSRMCERKPHWHHSQVKALDADGNPTWPEEHPAVYWVAKRIDVGEAAWLTEYMLDPVTEGRRFSDKWIGWKAIKPEEALRIVAYIDPSWRNTATSDHKAVKVWVQLSGTRKHLLRAFNRKAEDDEMVEWCYGVFEELREWPVVPEFYLEGIFMQDDHLQEFHRFALERGYHLPIVPDMRRKPQKESRIASMIPTYRRGIVTYEETQRTDADMMLSVQHLKLWDVGAKLPDDSPDADESAWHIIDHVVSFASGGTGMIKIGATARGSSSKYSQ